MKRILTIAAVMAVAAVPATSSAAGSDAASGAAGKSVSRGAQDLSISFVIRSRNGKPVEIRKFEFSKLTMTCDGGTLDVKGQIGEMNVNDAGKFDGKVTKGGGKVVVTGDSNSMGTRVEGTIQGKGDFGTSTGCDSGKVKWKAS